MRRRGRLKRTFSDFMNRNVQIVGKVLQERAASRRASLVEHDIGDHAIIEPNRLHVLTANVKDESGIGHIMQTAFHMGDGLHCMKVGTKGGRDHLLAVARRSKRLDVELDMLLFKDLIHLQ